MDVAILISVSILVVVLTILLVLLLRTIKKTPRISSSVLLDQHADRLQRGTAQRSQGPLGRGARRRPVRRAMLRGVPESDEDNMSVDAANSESEENPYLQEMVEQHEGKLGAKKLRKLQEKAEKRQNREAMEQERLDKKARELQREEDRLLEDKARKMEEEKRAEEELRLKEEKEQKEHEEYLKLKEMFSVDDEGQADIEADLNAGSLLQEFITYIKEMKVVLLEDLAAHFKLKIQDVIERVKALQESGDLTGVIDDRGKFIFITFEELESVAKFIRQRGRVSIAELAESSNHLIKLNPDNVDVARKLYSNTIA